MKWIYLLFIFILMGCAQIGRYPAANLAYEEARHVVLDIDWTIVSEIKGPSEHMKNSPRVVEVSGHYYYLNEGVEEFIEEVLSKRNVKISFYSGGSKERNTGLLSKIKLSSGKNLRDIAFKILNREDLISIPEAKEGSPFSERFKKDLTKVSEELDQLIMFDDTAHFAFEGVYPQNQHVFFTGTSLEFFESYYDANKLQGKYIPKSFEEWQIDRRKFFVLRTAFIKAYEASLDGKVSFSEAMKFEERKLKIATLKWNEVSYAYYQKSMQDILLKKDAEKVDCKKASKLVLGL